MTGHACAVCSRPFASANARAQHERRAHPEWKASPELTAEREREKYARYSATHPTAGAEKNARYRDRHPDRAAESERRYAAANRQERRDSTRRYRQTDAGRESARATRQRQIAEGKHSARMAVQRALDAGDLTRKPCEVCGAEPAEAHHHLGYERGHWLDVQWLCDLHHAQAHSRRNGMGKVVASYLVKVILRQPDLLPGESPEDLGEPDTPPTNEQLEQLIERGFDNLGFIPSVTSERTDR